MGIKFQKNGRVIVYSKGMTNVEAILYLEKRIAKRDIELKKRQWIVDEYNSLLAKNNLDKEWIVTLRNNDVVLSGDK